MAVEKKALHARQPVGKAVGVPPARLNKAKSCIGDKSGYGAAEEIWWGNEVGVEDRDIGRVRVLEAEGQIAGLEAHAFPPMENLDGGVAPHGIRYGLRQRFVFVGRSVVQKLDFEAVARPIKTGSRRGHPQRQIPFVANRKLHKNA